MLSLQEKYVLSTEGHPVNELWTLGEICEKHHDTMQGALFSVLIFTK